jgi:short-subunit dehydrogenase
MLELLTGWLRDNLRRRPGWINVLMFFCLFMALVYVPWDFFAKPVAQDEEVWLGLRLHGWLAKLTEPVRWWIYAALGFGFWRMRPWIWPWAALYTAQVALAMLVWNLLYVDSRWNVLFGALSATPFAALTFALWRSRARFAPARATLAARYPGWALVTGASAGIGAEFARQLAASGFSLVLTARREAKLRELAAALETAHGIATRVVVADLGAPDGADRVAAAVGDLDLSLLVNNAGFGLAGRFAKQDVARLREMVTLNCVAPTVLTALLLPGLRRRERAAIVFTGSVAGMQPLPLHAVYAATKGFDRLLGEALWAELRADGIDVLVLEPASTESEFHDVARELPHHGVPAADVVAEALDAIGQVPSLIPGWKPWLRGNLAMRLLPRSWLALAAETFTAKQTPGDLR